MSASPSPFEAAWPAEPESVPAARRAVVSHLSEAQTADPPLSDIALAISEAVTNVVNHAYLGRDTGTVRVEVAMSEEEIRVTVEDDGRGMLPRTDSPGMGLGLPLIATVCDRLDAGRGRDSGTRLCMWFRRDPGAATLPA